MDIRQPGFTLFSRFGENLGRLHVREAAHTEGFDGTDELHVTCTEDLEKNQYVVWRDRQGTWHEHIVDTTKRTHDDSGEPLTAATCINSINETWDDYVEDVRPRGTVAAALAAILPTTRWTVGTCTQESTASHTFYHKSVRECLQETLETWGGELVTVIHCDGSKVTGREVQVVAARGNQYSPKRFTWTKDLVTIARSEGSENPKSRLYAYGKGVETDAGGYGRRIGIESVNGGLPYVEDPEATALWGHPLPDGTIAPACGVFLDENCEDPAVLLAEALAALAAAKVPVVTYTADVLDLVSFGRDWEDVSLGDNVTIVDKEFCEGGLRLRGRISKVTRDLLTYDTAVTFGTLVDAIANPWQSVQGRLASLAQKSSNWDLASSASASWLDTLIESMNAAYDQAGTYHFSSFEQGEIWSSVPLDEDGKPTISGGWAMNINGMGFRLASTTNPDGSWNWRQFGNGNGFVATELIAGTISDALGYNHWDLESGDFTLASTATLGDRTVQQALSDIDATITSVDVQYAQNQSPTVAPTSGWSTTAPAYQAGYYIWQRTATTTPTGTSYSTPVMISGRDGQDGADGTSVTILGSYATYADLIADHPAGNVGDGYLVAGDLYVWDGTQWLDVGTIQGPQGPAGTNGTDGADGSQIWTATAAPTTPNYTFALSSLTGPAGVSPQVGDIIVYSYYRYTIQSVSTDSVRSGNRTSIRGAAGATGASGADGANAYVHLAWANSADGSVDFSTTVSAGKQYLGSYTDSTQADSQDYHDYSWSLIKGADGLDGEDGSDGVGITSTTIRYGRSMSDTVEPTIWYQNYPGLAQGQWLWVRTVYEYSDGSTHTAYAKSYAGTSGSNGTDGYNKAVINIYRRWSGSGLPPEYSSTVQATYTFSTGTLTFNVSPYEWSATIPANDGKPLWVRQLTFSSKTDVARVYVSDSPDPVILVENGLDGMDGTDGVGITSIEEQYYLSTSDQSPTGGSWSTTQPTWESGKYIWTRSFITWEDGVTRTTDPVLAKALTQANETANAALDTADDTADDLADLATVEGIFNALTNHGTIQGLFMQGGQLYINASYILSGVLKLGGANNVNGTMIVVDASDNTVATVDRRGVALTLNGYTVTGLHEMTLGYFRGVDHQGQSNTFAGLRVANSGETSGSTTLKTRWIILTPRYIDSDIGPSAITASDELGIFACQDTTYSPLMRQNGLLIEKNSFTLGNRSNNSIINQINASSTQMNFVVGSYVGMSLFYNSSASGANKKVFSLDYQTKLLVTATSEFNGAVRMTNNLTVTGTKSRQAATEDYGDRLLYAYETPEPYFGDIGSACTDESGECVIAIDEIFGETARADMAYQVFLQKCGPGDLWVAEKHPGYFVVRGTPLLAFDWEVKCHQRGYEIERLEDATRQGEIEDSHPNGMATVDEFSDLYADDLEYVYAMEDLFEEELETA